MVRRSLAHLAVVLLVVLGVGSVPTAARAAVKIKPVKASAKAAKPVPKAEPELGLEAKTEAETTPEIEAAEPAPAESPAETIKPTLPKGLTQALHWRSIGPATMGGRITALAVCEDDPSKFWVATASGGLLKTTNNGITFEHQFDSESTVSIGDVAVAPSDSNIVWVGTGENRPRNSVSWGNGVYKSVDGGKTWKHMGLEKTFQTGRIAIDPTDPNIVYVGAAGRLWGPSEERGLFKTTDGGETWDKLLYIDDKTGVIDVKMHPDDPQTLLAAAYERQRDGFDTNAPAKKWGPGGGLYKTTNGGKTWRRLSKGLPTCELGRIGLDYYRKNPDIVFAVIESERIAEEPENAPYMGIRGEDIEVGAKLTDILADGPAQKAELKNGDIVVSVDGVTVHSYDDMVSEIRKHSAGDTAKFELSRERKSVFVDVTFDPRPKSESEEDEEDPDDPGDPDKRKRRSPFHAGLGGQRENAQEQQGEEGYEYGGIYKSTDGGESWTRINSVNPRPMYFSQVRVDPSDDKNLYVLGISLYRSKDGGETFTPDGDRDVHPDHHALWIDPSDGRHMILGNDGGLYVTYDRMEKWDHLNHMAIGQFYHVAVDPRRNYSVYGGLQDNGSWGGPSRSSSDDGPTNTDWFMAGGGDGFVCLVDPNDPDQIYFEMQNGGINRRNLRTGERGLSRPRPPKGVKYRFNWKTPFILSNHNSRIYYVAGNHVLRSLDRGDGLKKISPEITRTDRGSGTALAESPLDADVLYVGTDDGALWVTRNGGHEWSKLIDFPGDDSDKADEKESDENKTAKGEGEVGADAGENSEPEPPAEPVGGRRRAPDGEPGRGPGPSAGQLVNRIMKRDVNGDGKIQKDEAPQRLAPMFDQVDTDGDGNLSREELEALAKRFSSPPPRPDPDSMSSVNQAIEGALASSSDPSATDANFGAANFHGSTARNFVLVSFREPTAVGAEKAADTEAVSTTKPVEQPAKTAEPAATEPAKKPDQDPGTEQAAAPEQTAAGEDPITGEWSARAIIPDDPGEQRVFTLNLKLAPDGKVTGSMSSEMGDGDISEGRFDRESNKLRFVYEAEWAAIEMTASVRGGKMTGFADVGGGMFTFDFVGERVGEATGVAGPEERKEEYQWMPLTELLPGPRWVSSIEASRAEAGRAYITFDAHRSDDDEPYVFVTENYGETWRSIRANLPTSAGSTRVIREDIENPNVLYLGTEFGAWVSVDRGRSWTTLNGKLPTVAVHEFAIHPTAGEVVLATHGRSLWVLEATPLRQTTAEVLKAGAWLYEPTSAIHWRPQPRRGGWSRGRNFVGENPPDGAVIYYLLNEPASYVGLRITDLAGKTISELEADSGVGLHRVEWNLQRARRGGRPSESAEGRSRRRGPRRGPLVESGTYLVELTVGDETFTRKLRVETDPDYPDYRPWKLEQQELESEEGNSAKQVRGSHRRPGS